MLSAIEILPGARGQIRPVRIVARDVPYYSDDSRWWSPDAYFKGGQISSSQEPAQGTDDPEFYETERWGHFSYAIPLAPGKYAVTLHFIEHHTAPGSVEVPQTDGTGSPPERVFNVFCNGKTVLAKLNILDEVGENHPLVRKIKGLEPNAQGKLLLEFVPVTRYATVSAIDVGTAASAVRRARSAAQLRRFSSSKFPSAFRPSLELPALSPTLLWCASRS
jgi:hypothetical protein